MFRYWGVFIDISSHMPLQYAYTQYAHTHIYTNMDACLNLYLNNAYFHERWTIIFFKNKLKIYSSMDDQLSKP